MSSEHEWPRRDHAQKAGYTFTLMRFGLADRGCTAVLRRLRGGVGSADNGEGCGALVGGAA